VIEERDNMIELDFKINKDEICKKYLKLIEKAD